MKFKHLAILAVGSGLAVLGVEPLRAQSAPADSTERLSPLDSNPACMERNGPACVTDEVGLRAGVPYGAPAARVSCHGASMTPNTPNVRPPTAGRSRGFFEHLRAGNRFGNSAQCASRRSNG